MLAKKLDRCLSLGGCCSGPMSSSSSLSHARRSKRTCDTNVESTVGVTASPTVAVFILFMAATWSTARRGLVELSFLE